jgi:hypothetical protein
VPNSNTPGFEVGGSKEWNTSIFVDEELGQRFGIGGGIHGGVHSEIEG